MENLGLVSNFIEVGTLLFGEVNIKYEVKNDHQDPDLLVFYLTRKIENIEYTATKEYEMFITSHGILLSSKDGDSYFEKYNFQSNISTSTWEDVLQDEDCPSFKS